MQPNDQQVEQLRDRLTALLAGGHEGAMTELLAAITPPPAPMPDHRAQGRMDVWVKSTGEKRSLPRVSALEQLKLGEVVDHPLKAQRHDAKEVKALEAKDVQADLESTDLDSLRKRWSDLKGAEPHPQWAAGRLRKEIADLETAAATKNDDEEARLLEGLRLRWSELNGGKKPHQATGADRLRREIADFEAAAEE